MNTEEKLSLTRHMTGMLELAQCEGYLRWMMEEKNPDPAHLARVIKQVYDGVKETRKQIQTSVEKLGEAAL